jgi:hypothetical protein
MLSGWWVVRLRRVVCLVAALAATVAMAAPGAAQAFAWKDQCVMAVANQTGSPFALQTGIGIIAELPPNPVDEFNWTNVSLVHNFPPSFGLYTIGFPITWGCTIKPIFKWYGKVVTCNVFAPSSGRNVFQCLPNYPEVKVQIVTDNNDIKGAVVFGSLSPPGAADPFEPVGLRASSAAVSLPRTRRVPALLRRGDLPGRGWRGANRVGQFGWLGQIFAADNLPASCEDAHKSSEPLAKRGGASAFVRRSEIVGYEHGVYANLWQSRQTLSSAVSTHGIGCLALLLTSARFHTHVNFARYSLPGLTGVTLWRLVVRTRAGDRTTRVDYLDVAGLMHHSVNALVLLANAKKPVRSAVEQSAIRTVASRLP